jgi:hypothetical protein
MKGRENNAPKMSAQAFILHRASPFYFIIPVRFIIPI